MAFTPTPSSIADLLPPVALDDVRAFLMAFLSVPQNKVTDYESGAVLRTMMELEAAIMTGLSGTDLPNVANNGYPGDSTGDSLTKLAHGWFAVERALPVAALQNVLLECDAGNGPYVITPNHCRGEATDGVAYNTTVGGTIDPGGQLPITMVAETPGQARGLVASLLDGFPGVEVIGAAIAVVGGIAQFGSDGDSDQTVTGEVEARFPAPDAIPSTDRAVAWAIAAVPTITRYKLDPDETYPGGVVVTLANVSGGISGGDVATVQSTFDDHAPITDVLTAQAASDVTVDVDLGSGPSTSTVLCPAGILNQAKVQADASWTAALSVSAIGGKVYRLALVKAVMDAVGPTGNFLFPALVGAGGDGNVALGSTQVPVPGVMPSALNWVAI